MPSIEKRGQNTWRLTVELGFAPDGSRIRERKNIKITDEALLKTTRKLQQYLDAELVKFQMEVGSGEYVSPEKITFATFVEKWKANFVKKNLEETTQFNYVYHTDRRIIPYFGSMKIDAIKTLHIVDFLGKLTDEGTGKASIVYIYRVLRSIFRWAKEWKVIKTDPMEGVPKPKEDTPEMRFYDEKEIARLLEALQNESFEFRMFITLAFTTGMRRGELLGLEWKHIDLEQGVIDVRQTLPMFKDRLPVFKGPKRKSSIRKITIPTSVIEELKQYREHKTRERTESELPWRGEDKLLLFCRPDGFPYHPMTWGDWWRDFHKTVPDLKYIRLHDLRHTSATLLISQGVHAKIISSRLGHSKISTTMNVYGHVIESADRAAAETFNNLFNFEKARKSN